MLKRLKSRTMSKSGNRTELADNSENGSNGGTSSNRKTQEGSNTGKTSRRSSIFSSQAHQGVADSRTSSNNVLPTCQENADPPNFNTKGNTLDGTPSTTKMGLHGKDGMPKKKSLTIVSHSFTDAESKRLESTIVNPADVNMPFGDGAEKLFGIENYGYICYVSSIFQCMYHTKPFREAILSSPARNPARVRKRKFTVPGHNREKIPQAIAQLNSNINGNTNAGVNGLSPTSSLSPNLQGSSITNGSVTAPSLPSVSSGRKLSLFSRSNDSAETHTSENEPENRLIYQQEDFTVSRYHQDKELEKYLKLKYPALQSLEINYYRNTQRNITLVGIINDMHASLEWRKKASLIRGPIINLDENFIEDYGITQQNMFTALKDAFECITENESKTGVLSPRNLIDIIKRDNIMFRNVQHQDAHEFLNFLINSILESVKEFDKESLITDIFEGELTSETKCLTCDNSSYRNEKFLDLSIDLEPDSSITNCLKMFSKIEMLNEKNKFYCENCYSYQEAAKTIRLRKLPKILAFHLKRFKYSEKLGRLVKLFYRVEYVKTIRISNTTKDSQQPDKLYELYGVVVHIGGGPYHGHYVSLVKTELYGWLLFDDETIEKIDEDFVFKFFGDGVGLSTAYLLFYREVENELRYMQERLYSGMDEDDDPMPSQAAEHENGRDAEQSNPRRSTARRSPDPLDDDLGYDSDDPLKPDLEVDQFDPFANAQDPEVVASRRRSSVFRTLAGDSQSVATAVTTTTTTTTITTTPSLGPCETFESRDTNGSLQAARRPDAPDGVLGTVQKSHTASTDSAQDVPIGREPRPGPTAALRRSSHELSEAAPQEIMQGSDADLRTRRRSSFFGFRRKAGKK